jgi:hypothetical protein
LPGSRRDTVERTLADIEDRVLGEVWIGHRRAVAHGVLTLLLMVMTAVWWIDVVSGVSAPGPNRVPTVTAIVLSLASAASGLALGLRRFRGCCAAAYTCGLGAVIGIGAFWWLRTGRPGATLTWLMIADVAVVLLTAGWLSVVITPIEWSQPDMRRSGVRREPHRTR